MFTRESMVVVPIPKRAMLLSQTNVEVPVTEFPVVIGPENVEVAPFPTIVVEAVVPM